MSSKSDDGFLRMDELKAGTLFVFGWQDPALFRQAVGWILGLFGRTLRVA